MIATRLCTLFLLVILFTACNNVEEKKENVNSLVEKGTDAADLYKLDIDIIKNELGLEGKENNGEFKITVPQNDLNISVDGFRIIPPMGLGSWIAFTPTTDNAMIMGDIVVTEQDLKPVQQEVIRQGLSITAIHNHFVRNTPDVMYMHIGGMGEERELARKVKGVLNKVNEIREGNPADVSPAEVKNTLDTGMISRALGYHGTMNNGVYKVTIGRPDVELRDHGARVSTFMGFNTWASWQGTPEKAAVAGDFTMLTEEVKPVIQALVENNIEVVALHNHMVHEDPRIFFLHYWGVGPEDELARGLKAALDKTGKDFNK